MKGDYYSGIGSRATPPGVLERMKDIAEALARDGWVLRSGAADGADAAFEEGALRVIGPPVEIYLPWRGFNGHGSTRYRVGADALALAAQTHPAWSKLTQGAQKLHARNCYQVLGEDLATPSRFVVCWTPDGCEDAATRTRATGGTGTAIAIAASRGVPVINLARPDAEERLQRIVERNGQCLVLFS